MRELFREANLHIGLAEEILRPAPYGHSGARDEAATLKTPKEY
jgi:hypothetical protein